MSQCGKPRSLYRVALEGALFGFGFAAGSLLFSILVQAALVGIFRVLGLGR